MRSNRYRRFIVSIHASAREATVIGKTANGETTGFNPRLRAGGDHQNFLMASL